MRKTDGKVTVTIQMLNYLNEVNDSAVIAEFRTIGWARDFLKELADVTSPYTRFLIEIVGNPLKYYITNDCTDTAFIDEI